MMADIEARGSGGSGGGGGSADGLSASRRYDEYREH